MAAISSLSVTKEPSAPSSPQPAPASGPGGRFPKTRRLLKHAEFRQVYDQGLKIPCHCFVAFCWKSPSGTARAGDSSVVGPRMGFTTPRALGKAVYRNRMKRRLREIVRVSLDPVDAHWCIVWNLRRACLDAPRAEIEKEVRKVLARCNG